MYLPQTVNAAANNEAASMLKRDVDNLAAYFGRFAPQILATSYGTEIWARFEAGGLHVDVELTGRVELDMRPVDLDSVLQELEATRLEEDARVRRYRANGFPTPQCRDRPPQRLRRLTYAYVSLHFVEKRASLNRFQENCSNPYNDASKDDL
jgi:serine/threonine-protein kinase RIO1